MAKFELPIYGQDDEVVKSYATNICPWGVFVRAAEASEGLKKKSVSEQMQLMGEILSTVFVGLTQEELEHADYDDVVNTFMQIVNMGEKIKSGNTTKNV